MRVKVPQRHYASFAALGMAIFIKFYGRYGHGGISNLKQMTPHCNELKSTRITSIELGEEEPNSWALLVGENIEALIFRVVKQWYDIGYVE